MSSRTMCTPGGVHDVRGQSGHETNPLAEKTIANFRGNFASSDPPNRKSKWAWGVAGCGGNLSKSGAEIPSGKPLTRPRWLAVKCQNETRQCRTMDAETNPENVKQGCI